MKPDFRVSCLHQVLGMSHSCTICESLIHSAGSTEASDSGAEDEATSIEKARDASSQSSLVFTSSARGTLTSDWVGFSIRHAQIFC